MCDRIEETSLHKASEEGHEGIVQILLSKAANVNLYNLFKATPLHKTTRNGGHESNVQLVISKGDVVKSCD